MKTIKTLFDRYFSQQIRFIWKKEFMKWKRGKRFRMKHKKNREKVKNTEDCCSIDNKTESSKIHVISTLIL
jgi:hypothetical protein